MKKCLYCDEMIEDNKNTCDKNKCKENYSKFHKPPNVKCAYCGVEFYLKPYRIKRAKNVCCSMECNNNLRKITMLGENNHQYGLKGKSNASWKSDEIITNYGYRKIRVLDHPFRDIGDYVPEHRLVAEKYLLTKENSIEINGIRYLKQDYVVHHKDFNKLNNNIENLEVMLRDEHTMLHDILRKQPKSKENGRFISRRL